MAMGIYLSERFAYSVNFQVDSVGPIGADVWSEGHLSFTLTELTFK